MDGEVTCPQCGAKGLSGSAFCQACGAALAAQAPATEVPSARRERLPAGPLALLASVVLAAGLLLVVLLSPGFVAPRSGTPPASPTTPQATATDTAPDGGQLGGGLTGTASPSAPDPTHTPRSKGGVVLRPLRPNCSATHRDAPSGADGNSDKGCHPDADS